MRYLSICQCPTHKTWMISIDEASGSGLRLTTEKCCGRWDVVKQFPMTAKRLRKMILELKCNAEQLEKESV